MVELGAGEIIVNSINNDGGMAGYDLNLVKCIADTVQVPVVALGGAGNVTICVTQWHGAKQQRRAVCLFFMVNIRPFWLPTQTTVY